MRRRGQYAWVASLVSMQSGAVYAMTKGAINILTKYLACEWAKVGVQGLGLGFRGLGFRV